MSDSPEQVDTPWLAYALIGVSVLAQSAGAALFKIGAQGALDRSTSSQVWWSIVWTWLNPYFVGGLVCLGVQTVAWMLVLRRLPLSHAYPFMACVLPVNLLVATIYFGEHVSWQHVGGFVLIGLGVVVVARSDHSGVEPAR